MSDTKQLVGLEKETFQSVIKYLSSKPYAEVSQLIQELSKGQMVNISTSQTETSSNEGEAKPKPQPKAKKED